MPLSATQLAEFCTLIEDGVISGKIGKDILPDLLEGKEGANRSATSSRRRSEAISTRRIEAIVDRVLEANPGQLEQYRGGKDKLKGSSSGRC